MADLYGTESGQNGGEGFEVNPIFQSDTVETWHGNNYPVTPNNGIQQYQAFEDLTMDQEVSNNSMHNSDEEYFLKLFQDFFNDTDQLWEDLFDETPAGVPKEIIEMVSRESPFPFNFDQMNLDHPEQEKQVEQHLSSSSSSSAAAAIGNVESAKNDLNKEPLQRMNDEQQIVDASLSQNNPPLIDSEMEENENEASLEIPLKTETRGRKPIYKNKEEKKEAHRNSSKKYNKKNTFQIRKAALVTDINGFESQIPNLKGTLNFLMNEFRQEFNDNYNLLTEDQQRQAQESFSRLN